MTQRQATKDRSEPRSRISITANLDPGTTRRSCIPSESESLTSANEATKKRSKRKLVEDSSKTVK